LHTALQLVQAVRVAERLAPLEEARSGIQTYWSLPAAAAQGLEYWADLLALQILAQLVARLAA
jgi:hypothetical protein